jgi:hypothetical protein
MWAEEPERPARSFIDMKRVGTRTLTTNKTRAALLTSGQENDPASVHDCGNALARTDVAALPDDVFGGLVAAWTELFVADYRAPRSRQGKLRPTIV